MWVYRSFCVTGTLVRDINSYDFTYSFSMNLQELYIVLSQKSSWISILKYWRFQFLMLFLKDILWITRRRNWRIQNWRMITLLERYSHCKVQTHILNFPKPVEKQRAIGSSRGSIKEGRFSLRIPVQIPWSEHGGTNYAPATAAVCPLLGAVCPAVLQREPARLLC